MQLTPPPFCESEGRLVHSLIRRQLWMNRGLEEAGSEGGEQKAAETRNQFGAVSRAGTSRVGPASVGLGGRSLSSEAASGR